MNERRGIVAWIIQDLTVEEKLLIGYKHDRPPLPGETWIKNNWIGTRNAVPMGIISSGSSVKIIRVETTSPVNRSHDITTVYFKTMMGAAHGTELSLTLGQFKQHYYLAMYISMHDCVIAPDNDNPIWKDFLNSYESTDPIRIWNWPDNQYGPTINDMLRMEMPDVVVEKPDPEIEEDTLEVLVNINATDKSDFTYLFRIIDESWRIIEKVVLTVYGNIYPLNV